ncbi:hypothetical protein PRUPE_2G111600 [Prunus persica]|uniref:Prenyltransferase alpha-alpha toroid domain-containing protein n=1 Tax=Prunus persica TaxID=3760 RepID=M5X3E6_PRUPE|nr:hypothetical protein PRUPE_2G111600 [Prunus persica]
MGELASQKHVQFIVLVEKKKDSFESVVMEHIRMNGAYWAARQDDSGGFGGNIGHDPHVLYTLSAVQVLALFDKLDVLDIEKVASYTTHQPSHVLDQRMMMRFSPVGKDRE